MSQISWTYDYDAAKIEYSVDMSSKPYWCSEDACKEIVEYEHYLELRRKFEHAEF